MRRRKARAYHAKNEKEKRGRRSRKPRRNDAVSAAGFISSSANPSQSTTGVGSSVGWSASYDDREGVVANPAAPLSGGKTSPGFLADGALSIQSAVSLREALVSPLVT